MKISLDYDGNCCLSKDCAYRKECAQHITAGDFRTEGGFAPQITKDLHCLTADEPPVEDVQGIFPANYQSLSYGYRADPFFRPTEKASDYFLTNDDMSLLQEICGHLYHIGYLLSPAPLNSHGNAGKSIDYGSKLESLINNVVQKSFTPALDTDPKPT